MLNFRSFALASTGLAMLLAATAAQAQDAVAAADDVPADEEIIVTGVAERQLLLDTETDAGSRLGLTVRETPAIVDILSERQIMEFGARTQIEALNRAPGVTASTPATSPGIPAMRGFSDAAISLLYDGVRVASPIFFGRTSDAWTFDRIEILKGPASVMFGEGALAGAVNLVPKKPQLGGDKYQALASYGSFESIRLAADANVPLSDTFAVRGVASYGSANADYVRDAESEFIGASLGAKFAPSDALTFELAFDHSQDEYSSPSFGTPLVPASFARNPVKGLVTTSGAVLDKDMARANYNYTDGVVKSDTQWLRSRIIWELNDTFRFTNEANKFHSDRTFINAEIISFNPTTQLVDRTTGDIKHDIDFWIERPGLAADFEIGGMRNRLSIGGELSKIEFATPRRFGVGTSVDPFDPVRTPFPVANLGTSTPARSYDVKTKAVFGENALNLTPEWLLVAGARQDWIDLEGVNAGNPIVRDYSSFSWRVGTVYDLLPKTQVFAMYSKAVASAGSFLSLNLANAQFDLSPGQSVEAGIKSTWWDGRVDLTLSGYWIEQDDILTRDPLNPQITIQGGSRSSRGVEMSLSAAVTPQLRIDANTTFLNARFDELIEAGGANRKGNVPMNVPETVSNLFAFYTFENIPLSINAGIRNTGRIFADNANTVKLKSYTLLDAAITYDVGIGQLKLQGRNLTDKVFVNFTDFGAGQVTLGQRRSVEVSFLTRF